MALIVDHPAGGGVRANVRGVSVRGETRRREERRTKIIKPSFELIDRVDGAEVLKKIELCGRTCYKSEDRINDGSTEKFVRGILKSGHESVIEHVSVTGRFICDRGVSHEIVRHRIASYSQESTRYCNYSAEKFGGELTFIDPCGAFGWEDGAEDQSRWMGAMADAENAYFDMIECGANPEEARSVLPNSLKTELVCTMNLREWRHFFRLRCSERAHPQMREVALIALDVMREAIPVVFDDLWEKYFLAGKEDA